MTDEFLRAGLDDEDRAPLKKVEAGFETVGELTGGAEEGERAHLMVALGQAFVRMGELDAAKVQFEEGLALVRSAGALATEAAARIGLGEVAWHHSDLQAARRHLQAVLALGQERRDVVGQGLAAQHLTVVSSLAGAGESTARAVSDRVFQRVAAFQAGSEQFDDMALLVARLCSR